MYNITKEEEQIIKMLGTCKDTYVKLASTIAGGLGSDIQEILQKTPLFDFGFKDINDFNDYSLENNFNINGREINDFEFIKYIPGIKKLAFKNDTIFDLGFLRSLSELTSLDCIQSNALEFADINNFKALEILRLKHNSLKYVSLKNLPKLKIFTCEKNKIEHIVIENSTCLNKLIVAHNKLKDISYCESIVSLETFYCEFNLIENLDGLKNCLNLKELKCYYNNINDISGLSKLTNLKFIDCSNNNISDISPLFGIKSLEVIDLKDNKIGQNQITEFKRQNPNCYVNY